VVAEELQAAGLVRGKQLAGWPSSCTAYGLMAPSSGGLGSQPRQQHENRSESNPIGESSRSTQQWKDVPRGTMDEVSSHVCLNLPFKLTARPPERLFYLVLESHGGRALVPIPKRSASP
jgi:hypothetical protein